MKVNSLDNTTAANLGRDLAKSLRPQMAILSWIIYTCVVISHKGADLSLILLGIMLFTALYGIVALQNDINDYETDRINQRKDIPYAADRLTESHLIYAMLALSITVTVIAVVIGYQSLPWTGLYILLGYLYSGPLAIKNRGTYAALLLGLCYGAMPWLIAASIIGQLDNIALLAAAGISFVFSTGIIVVKDFKDVIGDKATNKKTILVIKGPAYTRRYYLTITSAAYILLVIYSFTFSNGLFFATLAIITGIINYWLLKGDALLVSSKARSIRGKWARMLFFISILVIYSANIFTDF